jgi:siroheme synthase (precorrin-2 oxidase/ferrochelatase)
MKKNEGQVGGINKFFYPNLKTHIIIENLREQERLRKLEEERIEQDKKRYNFERKALKDEDINIYKEDNEENAESEENSEY